MKNLFSCNQCPNTFSEGGLLKTHLENQYDKNPFPCNECLTFFSLKDMIRHLRTHTDEKLFPCN